MTSYIPIIFQQIFSSSIVDSHALNATIDPGLALSNHTTDAKLAMTGVPQNLSSFIALLFSFSAMRDWLKLIVIGGFFETCRRLVFATYGKIVNSFFICASFDQGDASYNWILVWLSKQPSWGTTRDVQISTRSHGGNSPAVVLDGEDDNANEFFKTSRKISYLPSASLTYSLWYQHRWLTITRIQEQAGIYGEKENTLYIRILTRNHKVLKSLLQEARRFYMAGQEHNMCVYVSDSMNHWNHVACRAKRSMNSIVLDPGIKDVLVGDARDFLNNKSWYAERGIPFRRGYLLYGAPGSGKTSMIHCMAGELGLDVYIISLSRAGLDDSSLSELVNALPERCIALMEDIDAAFTHGVNRTEDAPPGAGATKPTTSGTPAVASTSKLSLSGLLNALDGVGAQEGRILFATTNKYSALDAALCRPGRMDLHVEFKNASKYQARELFSRFYLPTDGSVMEDIEEKENITDSGYESSSDNSDIKPSKSEISPDQEKTVLSPACDLPFTGTTHTGRAPKLSRIRIAKLAERFADAIPERECSMASIQGYLMAYKTRPVEAANEASAWVERERAAAIVKAAGKDKELMQRTEKENENEKETKMAVDDAAKETDEVKKPMLSTGKSLEASLPSPMSPTMFSRTGVEDGND